MGYLYCTISHNPDLAIKILVHEMDTVALGALISQNFNKTKLLIGDAIKII